MLHDGTRTFRGNLRGRIRPDIESLLDDFVDVVFNIVDSENIRRAAVRSMLECNIVVFLDKVQVCIAAERAAGVPTSTWMDAEEKELSTQAVYESAVWDFGFADPFVILLPRTLLGKDRADRIDALSAIAESHIQAETGRMQKLINMVQVAPIFGPASYTVDPRLVFVLMPFDEELTAVYNSVIKPAVESLDLELVCKRADDFKTNRAIIQDIWKAICEARLIIADLTTLNANVMYELGIAHTVGKETILVHQKSGQVTFPFDLAHIRRIEYVNDAPGGKKLEEDVKTTIRTILRPQVQSS